MRRADGERESTKRFDRTVSTYMPVVTDKRITALNCVNESAP